MDQLIGKMLDNRYEILDVIGVGGMSVVYKAYCHRLHRFVAVKVLKRDLAGDDEFRRRFHEEAQAVAMLSHPNIVAVYDVSKGQDLDYIVMELIDGITLKQYMQKKNGTLNWREALYFTNQIVQALGHAHGRGIIHRDIKPQNIMVLRDGSVKVADFGIARILSASQSSTLTQEALGSVHYISPEQARGSHIDARADLYSAGVVLYEMLTGRLPFDGDTPVSVALQHINSTPLSPRELNPDIPAGLEEITMKAMAPRLDQRYLNAEAMLRDLEEFRKDPEMTFHYNLSGFRNGRPRPEEPFRKAGDTQPRRTRVLEKPPVGKAGNEEDEEDYDDGEDEGGHRLLIPLVVILCLVAAAAGLWLAFFSGAFQRTEMVQVPGLLGKTITEVTNDQTITDNFLVNRVSTEYSDEFKEGEIISQDPAEGQSVEKGTTINVVVSGGKEYLEMIDVIDMSFDKAAAQLETKGFIVEEPEYEYSDSVSSGNVISSSPMAGEPILPGDSVHLVVSLGVEVKTVRVPSVTGQSLEGARVTLTSHGLTIVGVTEVTNDRPQGQVIYQSIAANTEVEEGTSLTLQVSKGPEKEEEPEIKVATTVVPTVTGQTLENARNLLADADLRIASVTEVDSDAPAGQVVYQSIPAGTSVEEDTGISIQVSKGPAEVVEPEPEPEPEPEEEPEL